MSSASGGSCVRQICCAFQHRVWNRQAGGGASGLGTSPSSLIRSRRSRCPVALVSGSGTGTAESRATVYGWRGLKYSWSRLAVSTILPRYMTATWSAMCRTTDRSCAITT